MESASAPLMEMASVSPTTPVTVPLDAPLIVIAAVGGVFTTVTVTEAVLEAL